MTTEPTGADRGEDTGDRRPPAGQVFLRPIGNSLPLGFLALALATTAFSALQLGWITAGQGRLVALAALLFTAPLQLVASVFAFLARDSVAGVGMGILSGTWATIGAVTLVTPAGTASSALGVVLVAAAVLLVVPVVAGLSKLAAAAVIAMSAVRFAVTGVYEITASQGWKTAAGLTGLVLVVPAYYAALAFTLEEARGHTVLPLRIGGARKANVGEISDDLEEAARQPGVRKQL